MSRYTVHRVFAIVLLALAGAALVFLPTAPLRARRAAAVAEQADLLARQAHLLEQMTTFGSAELAQAFPAEAAWPGVDRTSVESGLQDRVLETAEANGLHLTSFGPGAVPPDLKTPAVGYQIEAQADWQAVLTFVDALLAGTPAVGISELSLRGGRKASGRRPAGA